MYSPRLGKYQGLGLLIARDTVAFQGVAEGGGDEFGVAAAAHLGDEAAARAQHGGHTAERVLGAGHPVQRGIGEHGVDGRPDREFVGVHHLEAQP